MQEHSDLEAAHDLLHWDRRLVATAQRYQQEVLQTCKRDCGICSDSDTPFCMAFLRASLWAVPDEGTACHRDNTIIGFEMSYCALSTLAVYQPSPGLCRSLQVDVDQCHHLQKQVQALRYQGSNVHIREQLL